MYSQTAALTAVNHSRWYSVTSAPSMSASMLRRRVSRSLVRLPRDLLAHEVVVVVLNEGHETIKDSGE